MLHELLTLRSLLLQTGNADSRSIYEEKLEIIQHNLYGVDNDPIAVGIARLRLWLSLIVDFEGASPPPLPNLDYKIMVGDSLVETVNGEPLISEQAKGNGRFQYGLAFGERADLQAEFKQLRERLFDFEGTGAERRELKERLLEIELDLVLALLREQRKHLDEREASLVAKRDWKVESRARRYRRELAELESQRSVVAEVERQVAFEQRRPAFPWRLYFAEVFERGGFDVMLANPPYVRADAQFKHLIGNEVLRQEEIARWKRYRALLAESGLYETLYEKWDLYIPFLERAFKLLRDGLHFAKAKPRATDTPVRVRRWGKSPSDFSVNSVQLPSAPQQELGRAVFRSQQETAKEIGVETVPLGYICYISYGLRASAHESKFRGEFVKEDVLSDFPDTQHPRSFVEGDDLQRWWVTGHRYLEWGTERAPYKFARPTFPELYSVEVRLLAKRICGNNITVVLDDKNLVSDHTTIIFILWNSLVGISNKSIQKKAKYRNELKPNQALPDIFREDLESLSRNFHLKYVLSIMNSAFAKAWLVRGRRGKLDIYPDDWKQLPIAAIPLEQQQVLISLVDQILAEYAGHGYPLPPDSAARVAALERAIDARVYDIYGITEDEVELLAAATASTDLGEAEAIVDE